MRRIPAVLLTILAIVGAVAVGFAAYDAGFDAGVTEYAETTNEVVAGEGQTVVRVIDGDRRGFFPFGFLFFPFVILFWFLVFRLLFWGRWRGPGGWGRGVNGGEWPEHVERRAREWHQREHDASTPAQPGPNEA